MDTIVDNFKDSLNDSFKKLINNELTKVRHEITAH